MHIRVPTSIQEHKLELSTPLDLDGVANKMQLLAAPNATQN